MKVFIGISPHVKGDDESGFIADWLEPIIAANDPIFFILNDSAALVSNICEMFNTTHHALAIDYRKYKEKAEFVFRQFLKRQNFDAVYFLTVSGHREDFLHCIASDYKGPTYVYSVTTRDSQRVIVQSDSRSFARRQATSKSGRTFS
jgi:hypothetical protein